LPTFNINNVNKRFANLLQWLRDAKPDVVCLQELKSTDSDFPRSSIAKAGYGAVWRGQKSWNGVAILARGCEPVVTRNELPGDARTFRAAISRLPSTVCLSLAVRAERQSHLARSSLTSSLDEASYRPCGNLYAAGVPVVLAGDYNIVPHNYDIYPTNSYAKNALVQPQSRAAFQRLLRQGLG